jgi:glycosyltransferase involved in cell wall biosynthesis
VNVLMVTPHLPPHQAANALLPHLLGQGLQRRGHRVRFLTFGDEPDGESIRYVRRRGRRLRATRVPQALEALQTWQKTGPLLDEADVVHVHSSTWMNQVAARLAARRRKPYVLTHYGTEIWHHDGRDRAFRRFNRDAGHVTFYSAALQHRARELQVPVHAGSVVYPPVADAFHPLSDDERAMVRRRYLSGDGPLLVNVKRLHPLADHATLLSAMARVLAGRPDATLLIAGSGETRPALEALSAHLRLGERVRFLGLVPNAEIAALQGAADLFVLSSTLEATPTVALEALACGTPVVSTDNPGGVELQAIFGHDVAVVPKSDADALAVAVLEFLRAPRRTAPVTAERIAERFRLDGVVDRYLDVYRQALSA